MIYYTMIEILYIDGINVRKNSEQTVIKLNTDSVTFLVQR